jgi:hypothetical protein
MNIRPFKYNINVYQGVSKIQELDKAIQNETTLVCINFVNLNTEEDAVFGIPTVEFLKFDYMALGPSTTEPVESHKNMFIKKIS